MQDNTALIEAIRASGEIHTPSGNGIPYTLVPTGYRMEKLEQLLPAPVYTNKDVTVLDSGSFIQYVENFGDEGTAIFVTRQDMEIEAIIDYPTSAGPRHGAHRITLKPNVSEEWKRWSAIDGRYMDQKSFAEFLEENSLDIVQPDAATLVEVARQIEATKRGEFRSGTRLDNGSFQFAYTEEINATTKGGSLAIPSEIKLGIPVFEGGERYEIKTFFRYRIDEGTLKLAIKINRPKYILDDAFNHLADEVRAGLSEEVFSAIYFGRPPI